MLIETLSIVGSRRRPAPDLILGVEMFGFASKYSYLHSQGESRNDDTAARSPNARETFKEQ